MARRGSRGSLATSGRLRTRPRVLGPPWGRPASPVGPGSGETYQISWRGLPADLRAALASALVLRGAKVQFEAASTRAPSAATDLGILGTVRQFQAIGGGVPPGPRALRAASATLEQAVRNHDRSAPRTIALAHGGRLRVGDRPRVMGILNVTPDSFYDGGRFADPAVAVEHGLRMEQEGADLLDVGGESTRPGSQGVSASAELRRVLPVVEGLRRRTRLPISIDTTKPEVASAALKAGAEVVNDVTGLSSAALRRLVARSGAGAVVMHMRGTPRTMQGRTAYQDIRAEVFDHLDRRTAQAEAEGIGSDQLVVDPGIGFGKDLEGNLALLSHVGELRSLGYPVLVGASRKSFLGALTGGAPASERLEASLAAAVAAAEAGVELLRVHDVGPTVKALRVVHALRAERD